MTTNDQAANQTVSPAKLDWVKPEIESMGNLANAEGGLNITNDGNNTPTLS